MQLEHKMIRICFWIILLANLYWAADGFRNNKDYQFVMNGLAVVVMLMNWFDYDGLRK